MGKPKDDGNEDFNRAQILSDFMGMNLLNLVYVLAGIMLAKIL